MVVCRSLTCSLLLLVDRVRVERLCLRRLPVRRAALILAEEARSVTLVTRGDVLLDLEQKHVAITIGAHFLHVLKMPAAFPLEREPPAAAAVRVNLPRLQRPLD